MKKKIYCGFLLFFCFSTVYSQDAKMQYLGISAGHGENDYFRAFMSMEGEASYRGKGYFNFGFDYQRQISKRFDFCTGITLFRENMETQVMGIPPLSDYSYNSDFYAFAVPLQYKYHFLKYLFLNGGIQVTVAPKASKGFYNDMSITPGATIGIGAEYEFKNHLVLSLNPFFAWNGLLPGFQLVHSGINLGVGYRFAY